MAIAGARMACALPVARVDGNERQPGGPRFPALIRNLTRQLTGRRDRRAHQKHAHVFSRRQLAGLRPASATASRSTRDTNRPINRGPLPRPNILLFGTSEMSNPRTGFSSYTRRLRPRAPGGNGRPSPSERIRPRVARSLLELAAGGRLGFWRWRRGRSVTRCLPADVGALSDRGGGDAALAGAVSVLLVPLARSYSARALRRTESDRPRSAPRRDPRPSPGTLCRGAAPCRGDSGQSACETPASPHRARAVAAISSSW